MGSGAIAGHFVRNAQNKFDYVLDLTAWGFETPHCAARIQGAPVGDARSRSFIDYANRNTKGWEDAVANGSVRSPHAYMAFFLPFEKAKEMSDFLLAHESANLGARRIMLSPLRNEPFQRPYFRMPGAGLTAHFRVYRIADHGEGGADHLRMLASNENEIVPKVLELGGRVYLPFSPLLSAQQRVRHYGQPTWQALSQFQTKLDPKRIVNFGAGLK